MSGVPEHVAEAKEAVAAGDALLLDVREPHEWAQGHFKSAINVPLSALQRGMCPPTVLSQLDRRLYLHCAAGVRVHSAAPVLHSLGCLDVVPLQEGFQELYYYQFDDLADASS